MAVSKDVEMERRAPLEALRAVPDEVILEICMSENTKGIQMDSESIMDGRTRIVKIGGEMDGRFQ
jgi:hypothetical protein